MAEFTKKETYDWTDTMNRIKRIGITPFVINDRESDFVFQACNNCYRVNPDNPMAVAESIKDMYEALKGIIRQANKSSIGVGSALIKQIRLGEQALAKAEGKKEKGG